MILSYKILNTVEKVYSGDRFHALRFRGRFRLSDLTPEEIEALGVLKESPTGGTIFVSELIPPYEDKDAIKLAIVNRMETKKIEYFEKVTAAPTEDTQVVLSADEIFIPDLDAKD